MSYDKPITFRLGGIVLDVDARHDDAAQAQGVRSDVSRYYRLLQKEFDRLAFTDRELGLLSEVIRPTTFGEENFDLLYGHVDKVLYDEPEVAKRHRGVDVTALLKKVRALGPAQSLALIDAVERYWRAGRPKEARSAVLATAGYGEKDPVNG